MKTRFLTTLLILALINCSSFAGEYVSMSGNIPCGDWLKERKTEEFKRVVYENRLMAYLSGVASGTGIDILKELSNNSAYFWIDNYCQKNPLETVYEGAGELAVELKKKILSAVISNSNSKGLKQIKL